eukprot:SAG31_NODE_114_length_24318_cov_16.787481_4_plen_409_part_00
MRLHGIRTARDVQLLAAPETEELMAELKAGSGRASVPIGDRSKVRLLVAAASQCQHTNGLERRDGVRSLQQEAEGNAGGVSFDTIAIVVSVLIGAVGYIVQAYTARQSERSAEDRQQELQVAESRRQREHEQMLAQIARTEEIVDQCCDPALRLLWVIKFQINNFNAEGVGMLLQTHPEVVAQLVSPLVAAGVYSVAEDGTVTSKQTGLILWVGTKNPALCRSYPIFTQAQSTAEGVMLGVVHQVQTAANPWCVPLIETLLNIIKADHESKVAEEYRAFCRVQLVPPMRKIARLIEEHGMVLQLPNKDFLGTKFPGESWSLLREDFYLQGWLSRTAQWERLLSAWDAGDFSDSVPRGDGVIMPLEGLNETLMWSLEYGRAKQGELIGLTKANEEDVTASWNDYAVLSN